MSRNRLDRTSGLTLIELLVAMGIVVIILGIASVFFARQVQLQRSVQTRSEVQDRVRVVMQLVSQDLALAGNSAVIGADGAKAATSWPFCFDGARGCIELTSAGSEVRMRYLSSQFPLAEACRDVEYKLVNGAVQRSDVVCENDASFIDLAPNVVKFGVEILCSDGGKLKEFPSTSCGGGLSYGRSAVTTVVGQSRIPMSGSSPTGCPADRYCFEMTQETLIPNMKDQ